MVNTNRTLRTILQSLPQRFSGLAGGYAPARVTAPAERACPEGGSAHVLPDGVPAALGEVVARGVQRLVQALDRHEGQAVGMDEVGHAPQIELGGQQLGAFGRVDAVEAGPGRGRAGDAEMHLGRAGVQDEGSQLIARAVTVAEVADEELAEVATRGADAVRDALPENPGEALVRRVRAQMWGPLLGGDALQFPAGMAFGAHALGFLRPGGRARLSTAGPWTRLDTPGGFVLGRPAMAV